MSGYDPTRTFRVRLANQLKLKISDSCARRPHGKAWRAWALHFAAVRVSTISFAQWNPPCPTDSL